MADVASLHTLNILGTLHVTKNFCIVVHRFVFYLSNNNLNIHAVMYAIVLCCYM